MTEKEAQSVIELLSSPDMDTRIIGYEIYKEWEMQRGGLVAIRLFPFSAYYAQQRLQEYIDELHDRR